MNGSQSTGTHGSLLLDTTQLYSSIYRTNSSMSKTSSCLKSEVDDSPLGYEYQLRDFNDFVVNERVDRLVRPPSDENKKCCSNNCAPPPMPYCYGARVSVTHSTYFPGLVLDDAIQVTNSFEKMLTVMVQDNGGTPLDASWEGTPDAIGSTMKYQLNDTTSKATIHEKILRRGYTDEESKKEWVMEWTNVGSDPPQPLQNYHVVWKLKRMEHGTRLEWARSLDSPYAFGCIPAWPIMKKMFIVSGGIINENFALYYSSRFPSRLPKLKDKIVIVGGGPSGLHIAHCLIKQGYLSRQILILEKEPNCATRTGRSEPDDVNDTYGKTFSIQDDTSRDLINTYNTDNHLQPQEEKYLKQVVHELGTCYLHPAYFAVRALFEELKQKNPNGEKFEEVGPDSYVVRREGLIDSSLDDWITSMLQVQPTFSIFSLSRLMCPVADTMAELMLAKEKYNRLHLKYFGDFYFTMPPPLPTENLKELDMSFMQFLENNGLTSLVPLLAYGQTCQGYGSIERTPAFWAMCWITPQLLDGYFNIRANLDTCLSRNKTLNKKFPWYPKKAMLVDGWASLWREIKKQDRLNIIYDAEVTHILRNQGNGGSTKVVMKIGGKAITVDNVNYVIIAAPILMDPQQQVLQLDETERTVFGNDNFEHGTFRTTLFSTSAQPYLGSHLTIYPSKIVGPNVGYGEVFATRDSYLAINKPYCVGEGPSLHQSDPMRNAKREQMAYQYVENGYDVTQDELDAKFKIWAEEQLGPKNYDVLLDPRRTTWKYFYRFNRSSLLSRKLWGVFALQGHNNTMYVHASTFFESVLDIVNYNNMMMDCFTGKFNVACDPDPKNCYKPKLEDTLDFSCRWHLTVVPLFCLTVLLNLFWTLFYILLWPLNSLIFFRLSRYNLQKAFKTENLGGWWTYTLKKFIDISPTSASFISRRVGKPKEDPVVTLIYEQGEDVVNDNFPGIQRPLCALDWNFQDYRTMIAEWLRLIKPNFLTCVGSWMASFIGWLSQAFPIIYGYMFAWIAAISFSHITGYCYKVEDKKGGGLYVPECQMLKIARRDYGVEAGDRICSHVCKIFTEEFMKQKGLNVTFEPNFEKGSCMVRSGAPKGCSCSDNALYEWKFRKFEVVVLVFCLCGIGRVFSIRYHQGIALLAKYLAIHSSNVDNSDTVYNSLDGQIKVYKPKYFQRIRNQLSISESEFRSSFENRKSKCLEATYSQSKQEFHLTFDEKFLIKSISRRELNVLFEFCENYSPNTFNSLHEIDFIKNFSSKVTGNSCFECEYVSPTSANSSGYNCIAPVLCVFRIQPNAFINIPYWIANLFRMTKPKYFIITRNVFDSIPKRDNDHPTFAADAAAVSNSCKRRNFWRYDLKGSSIGRSASKSAIMGKDNDLLSEEIGLKIGKRNRDQFLKSLQADVTRLADLNIMDYSLLVGILPPPQQSRTNCHEGNNRGIKKSVMEVLLSRSSKSKPCISKSQWLDSGLLVFAGDDGCLYQMGIVDILQRYTFRKRVEHWLKSLAYDGLKVSCVHPQYYASRMMQFITAAVDR